MTDKTRNEICICCANGNDLSAGDVCAACFFGEQKAINDNEEPKSELTQAIEKARGGPAPIKFRGYA
jgi:hypothetical protein